MKILKQWQSFGCKERGIRVTDALETIDAPRRKEQDLGDGTGSARAAVCSTGAQFVDCKGRRPVDGCSIRVEGGWTLVLREGI